MGVGLNDVLISGRVWSPLTRAAKQASRPSYVAVAYFGKGADRLLPLRRGSFLVVDASDAAVKSGQTCPASLRTMLKRGVFVYSCEGLHAKVFVFDSAAYVGSANVSGNSEKNLIEAIVATKQRATVASARQFVRSCCHRSLGRKELDKLGKIYREPIWRTGKTNQSQQTTIRLRIVRLIDYDPPEEMEEASEKGELTARKKLSNTDTHTLYEFHWRYEHKFHERELILPIYKDREGKTFVCAPGAIVSLVRWKRNLKRKTIVFLEVPRHRRIAMKIAVKRIGRTAGKKLRSGRIITNPNLVSQLLDMFPTSAVK